MAREAKLLNGRVGRGWSGGDDDDAEEVEDVIEKIY